MVVKLGFDPGRETSHTETCTCTQSLQGRFFAKAPRYHIPYPFWKLKNVLSQTNGLLSPVFSLTMAKSARGRAYE